MPPPLIDLTMSPESDDSNSSLTSAVLASLGGGPASPAAVKAEAAPAPASTAVRQRRASLESVREAFRVPVGRVVKLRAADLWIDAYRPHALEDLAVHKVRALIPEHAIFSCVHSLQKKSQQLRAWLEDSFRALALNAARAKKILVLTGPAGCGKTTAVQLIAQVRVLQLCVGCL